MIAPAIARARGAGHDVTGPLPADTVFVPEIARRFDAIVAMYHDQGLPVLKAASFGHGINVTLGLPFIRTSVDHGTALDLAADAQRRALPIPEASSPPSISPSHWPNAPAPPRRRPSWPRFDVADGRSAWERAQQAIE